MSKDYRFYNEYCHHKEPIDFKTYVLDQLRDCGYFPWLRDEPRGIEEEKYFLNSTLRIPYLEREIERDEARVKKAKDFLSSLEEYPDEEYSKYVKDETEKWQAQYNTRIHNADDYATEYTEQLNKRADEFSSFLTRWTPPSEFCDIIDILDNQLLAVREEIKKIQSDRAVFYRNLPEKPELMSKAEFINSSKEYYEDTIKRCQDFISNNKKNIEGMKKEDEATHKLFESLKAIE